MTIPAPAINGMYAAALVAIGHHIHTHDLPTPRTIDRRWHPSRSLVLEVRLDPDQHQPWIDSLLVDELTETIERPEAGAPYIRSTWTVRLPENGTWFYLTCSRRRTASLELQIAGAGA